MVFLVATLAAVVCAVIEIFLNLEKKNAKDIIKICLRNIVCVDVLSIGIMRYFLNYQHFIDTSSYKSIDYLYLFVIGIGVGILVQAFMAIVYGRVYFEKLPKSKHPHIVRTGKIISAVLLALGVFAKVGTDWGREAFGKVTGDQLIINLTSPTEGTEASVYIGGFEGPVFAAAFCLTAFCIFLFTRFKLVYKFKEKKFTVFNDISKRIICFALACVILYVGVDYGIKGFRLDQVFNAYVLKSTIIEDNYVDPLEAKIEFPEKKRNLIHIYLESMENSYLSKDLGGYLDTNIIPKLTQLAYDGTVFSDTDKYFGGPLQGTGTQWSLASMVNQTTGLPMKAPGWTNAYGSDGKFLPGANTLGELLEQQGYEQTVMIGASATFGGLNYLFSTHGNWKIMDYKYALKNGLIPEGYKVWWGYEDDKLYEFAKDEITRLYETGKPFNFTMETADTHRPGGYLPKGAKTPYKSKYANVILNSSNATYEFVKWIQEQPFYENTTIVIIGDHLSMDTKFFKIYNFTEDYHRTQFNLILNPAPGVATDDVNITRNRLWANWDYFPTIVASIGGKIEGERLGIGTNLFSGKPTIYEELGVENVDKELQKGSVFYNEKILEVDNLKEALKSND